ncbi:MAG: iron hydrogenase small subunit [Clostridia bacterium]
MSGRLRRRSGQPTKDGYEFAGREARSSTVWTALRSAVLSRNSAVQLTYEEYLGQPNSRRAHELLHTDLENWDLEMNRKDIKRRS